MLAWDWEYLVLIHTTGNWIMRKSVEQLEENKTVQNSTRNELLAFCVRQFLC